MITEQIAAEPPFPERPEHAAQTDLLDRVTAFTRRMRTLIEQRPVVAVLTAAGVGYVVARLASRGRR